MGRHVSGQMKGVELLSVFLANHHFMYFRFFLIVCDELVPSLVVLAPSSRRSVVTSPPSFSAFFTPSLVPSLAPLSSVCQAMAYLKHLVLCVCSLSSAASFLFVLLLLHHSLPLSSSSYLPLSSCNFYLFLPLFPYLFTHSPPPSFLPLSICFYLALSLPLWG